MGTLAEDRKEIQEAVQKGEYTIAIDGEGYTDSNGRHRYTYMAAASSTKVYGWVENKNGLRASEIFVFLLSLPKEAVKVGFSLGYDKTKWFESLPNSTIYLLNHPDLRRGDHGPRPITAGPGILRNYRLNAISTQFSVAGKVWIRGRLVKQRCIVWDMFRFFGKAFVGALADWEIGSPEDRAIIQAGKDRRGNFESISDDEKKYCQSEVILMAQMADKLLRAHKDADIGLKQYYGPGSTASVMLNIMNAKAQTAQIPFEMEHAVESAFFGGRFETSLCGPVPNVYGYDIASAYPYVMTGLPCLEHGRWELVQGKAAWRAIQESPVACVHYRLPMHDGIKVVKQNLEKTKEIAKFVKASGVATKAAWGPFPFRLEDGNILYPVVSPGGWVWKDEFLSGIELWPNVEIVEAWVLRQDCGCSPPFAKWISHYFNLRLEWGKEGKGLVVKLGINSCYGKRAQRIGNPPFRCATSAGLITSGTRAILNRALATVGNPLEAWDILSLATDGIQSTRDLTLATPRPTGTEAKAAEVTEKARQKAIAKGETKWKHYYSLGSWEAKGSSPNHLIRPGMRFCTILTPSPEKYKKIEKDLVAKNASKPGKTLHDLVLDAFTAEMQSETAARGLGVKDLHKNRELVMDLWKKAPMEDVKIKQPNQFMGAKGCVRISTAGKALWEKMEAESFAGDVHQAWIDFEKEITRDAKYGCWIDPPPRLVSYNPLPKRPIYFSDEGYRMGTWALLDDQGESRAYKSTKKSELARQAEEQKRIESDQPDQGDWNVFDVE